jgi:hypothetical protein
MVVPSLAHLVWCWYWQSQLPVEDNGEWYRLTLPNHQVIEVEAEAVEPSWRYSGEVTGLHPATYATESLWEATQNLEWRIIKGEFRLTVLSSKVRHYDIPIERIPHSNHLAMTKLLRRGYRIEERKGLELLVHTPRGAIRQVRASECTCGEYGMCVHKQLGLYYAQFRPLLRRYPELAKDAPQTSFERIFK